MQDHFLLSNVAALADGVKKLMACDSRIFVVGMTDLDLNTSSSIWIFKLVSQAWLGKLIRKIRKKWVHHIKCKSPARSKVPSNS